VPGNLRRLFEKCLQKNPKKRLRDIGDVWELVESAATKTDTRPTSKTKRVFAAAWILTLIALTGLGIVHFREKTPVQVSGLFSVSLPEKSSLGNFMLSPDGRKLAFTSDQGGTRVWVRPMDSLEAQPLPGTDGATFPFWSPDGKNLGFFAQGSLKRIALAGGPAQTLAPAPTPRGGAWNHKGVILFAPNIDGGLFRIPQDGGTPVQVTMTTESNQSHRYPEFIEGGDQFLFMSNGDRQESSGLFTASLNGGKPTHLLSDNSHALYVPPPGNAQAGALLFERASTLMALPFDPRKLRAIGSAIPIAQEVPQAGTAGFAAFTASENGILLYRSGNEVRNLTLMWLDSFGKATNAVKESQPFESLSLSPDGKRVAVSVVLSNGSTIAPGDVDVWLQDLESQVATKFTFGPRRQRHAIWSPDGSYVLYVQQPRPDTFVRKPVRNGSAEEVLLELVGSNSTPLDISHDGKLLVYSITGAGSKDDLWILPLEGNHTPIKYLDGPSDERHAQFSPDGKWIAYSSDEQSGRFQVYLQSVPPGNKQQISTQGGSRPRWRKDGKELYYISADLKLMAVPMNLGPGTVNVGTPRQLFALPALPSFNPRDFGYQPSPDGKFLTLVPAERQSNTPPSVTVRINWMSVLSQ